MVLCTPIEEIYELEKLDIHSETPYSKLYSGYGCHFHIGTSYRISADAFIHSARKSGDRARAKRAIL